MGSLHQIQLDQTRKIPTPCCHICEWGLLKRNQCYIYAKQTKMASTTTKKNQHKNGNDVQDSSDVITLWFVVVWISSIIKVNQDGRTNERTNARNAISPPPTLDNAMNLYFPLTVQYFLIYTIIITFKVFPIAYSEIPHFPNQMEDKNKLKTMSNNYKYIVFNLLYTCTCTSHLSKVFGNINKIPI